MFNDYENVKNILRESFSEILALMDEYELTYDEIKDLLVKTLYTVSKEDKKKAVVHKVVMPQVLYGPPQMKQDDEVHVYKEPQVLYGPPQMKQEEEVHVFTSPQVLYGPPQMKQDDEVHVFTNPQVLYGPPKMEELNIMIEDSILEHGDEYIPGTNIYKPRDRKTYETDEEYVNYLDEYYGKYFPNSNNGKARR